MSSDAADVLDGRARAQRAEGNDLRDLLPPVLFGDVLDHFAAPARAEIDVDIGHADALGIQEALKQQPVSQRIDIGDLHRVADQAAGGRAAARPHRNALLLGEADEVPDDQEVARELHLLDHLDFAIQPLGVFGEVVLQLALRAPALPGACGASRIPAARRIRRRYRWSAPRESSNFGNGSATFSSFTWQRCAISQVRSSASSTSPNSAIISSRDLQIELRAARSASGWGRTWSCRSGCTAESHARGRRPCADSANRWWRPAECRSRRRAG